MANQLTTIPSLHGPCRGGRSFSAATNAAKPRGRSCVLVSAVVTFEGTLGADGVSIGGTVTYHHGQLFPPTAKKRPAAGATAADAAPGA